MRVALSDGLSRWSRAIRSGPRASSGSAAVEFGLILPVLLALYMGGSEVTLAVMLHRKLQLAASTTTDLASQISSTNKTELDGIYHLMTDILRPYPRENAVFRLDAVEIDADGKAEIAWSYAKNATPGKQGDAVTLPSQFSDVRSAFIIKTKVAYEYMPMGGYGLKSPIAMGGDAYFRNRKGTKIECSDC